MGDARLLLKKNSDPSFFFDFFGYFCRRLRHADLDSREQQAILLKKRKISGQNFFFVFRRKIWHGFATPFSTFVNNKRVLFD